MNRFSDKAPGNFVFADTPPAQAKKHRLRCMDLTAHKTNGKESNAPDREVGDFLLPLQACMRRLKLSYSLIAAHPADKCYSTPICRTAWAVARHISVISASCPRPAAVMR